MSQEPRPLSRLKNIRVPSGKEDEYDTDAQGNIIHTTYGQDEELNATVVPSGKHHTIGGGSYDRKFDILGRDVRQNIVVFDARGAQQITEMTGRELARLVPKGRQIRGGADSSPLTKEAAEQLGKLAEASYRNLKSKQPGPVETSPLTEPQPVIHIEEDIVPVPKKKAKRSKKSLQRVVESSDQQVDDRPKQQQQQTYEPVSVEISAPFGKLIQTFSGIFRSGPYLVLYTDRRHVSSAYTFPDVDDPISVTIRWQDRVVTCLWVGISFTMPHVPVTFTVLLIDEGKVDGEGQPGQNWPDQV